jgi:hypothetical protein
MSAATWSVSALQAVSSSRLTQLAALAGGELNESIMQIIARRTWLKNLRL